MSKDTALRIICYAWLAMGASFVVLPLLFGFWGLLLSTPIIILVGFLSFLCDMKSGLSL